MKVQAGDTKRVPDLELKRATFQFWDMAFCMIIWALYFYIFSDNNYNNHYNNNHNYYDKQWAIR